MLRVLGGSWRLLVIACAMLLAAAVFVVPYHMAVDPSVSQSYRCGFNNHGALALFLCAAFLFAFAVGGFPVAKQAENRSLPKWVLTAAVLATLLLCVAWRVERSHKALGSESYYQLDRQIQMASGKHLYRDLEFIYGPLLEYPGYWLQTGLSWSPLKAYTASWIVDWLLGTAMLWCLVAWLDLPTKLRPVLFGFLYVFTLLLLPTEGTHYTPLRTLCAGFFSVAVAACWRRTQAPYRTAFLMILAIAGGFSISPEQGTALALGLSAYAVLLAWKNRARFPIAAAAVVPVCAVLLMLAASHLGLLSSMWGFAQGGNNFPVLPSPRNLFVLGTYVCALAVFYHAMRTDDWDSMAIPLGLCGTPMLSSAFGRCDLQHLSSALPLFLLGIFWLAGRPRLFVLWLVPACYFFLAPNFFLAVAGRVLQKASHVSRDRPLPVAVPPPKAGMPIPEGYVLFAPFAEPFGTDGIPRWGATSGRFYGLQNVLTPADIAAKAQEIRQRRASFLLLPDDSSRPVPLFWLAERDMNFVGAAEGSTWVPRSRRDLPSTLAVTQAVEDLYQPTAWNEEGWRMWRLRG